MLLRQLIEKLDFNKDTPNTFTTYLGEKVKEARIEAGISQDELAKAVYKRRPSISDIENGKMIPDFTLVCYLCIYFQKPFAYFIHPKYHPPLGLSPKDGNEQEVLSLLRRLPEQEQAIILKQLRALANEQ